MNLTNSYDNPYYLHPYKKRECIDKCVYECQKKLQAIPSKNLCDECKKHEYMKTCVDKCVYDNCKGAFDLGPLDQRNKNNSAWVVNNNPPSCSYDCQCRVKHLWQ